LILDSIDVWLLQQDTLIIKRKKSIIPAVTQRQVFADAFESIHGPAGFGASNQANKPSCDGSSAGNHTLGLKANARPINLDASVEFYLRRIYNQPGTEISKILVDPTRWPEAFRRLWRDGCPSRRT